MDPCPFVRVLVGNLALKMPVAPRPAGAGAGVHPSSSPCHCRIRLNKLPYRTAAAPLLPSDEQGAAPVASGALAAAFHLSKADLDRVAAKPSLFGPRSARLKVAVYAGRRGTTCGVNSGRLLGKVVIPLDLKGAAGKPVVFHSGWISIGRRGRKASSVSAAGAAQLNLTVRAEPDPRFVFEFDGEPEDKVEFKRLKQDDQIIPEKDHYTADAYEDVPEYPTYSACERSFNSPAYESEESEDEGADSPAHFPVACTYVEDHQQSPSFYQREGVFSSMDLCPKRKPVPIGPNHQAELPECISSGTKSSFMDGYAVLSSPSHVCYGTEDESDRWIRNCVMPMPGSNELSSTLEPVYRKAGCDCVDEDSINCVRKHVREAREKLKGALGSDTFKELGFYDMGEVVALRWTEEEEHLFQEVVSSNPASLGRNFWDELPLAFPTKTSKELVSYYFNVFMLRKRAEQNRFDPMNVDSDNDEWQESDDDEFAITRRADEDLPLESLTDQDEGVCNQVPPEGNIYEESDEEDELDYASVGYRQENCRSVEGDVMVSEGRPVMSFMDYNKQTSTFDADAQDDSCTSFEAQQVGVVDATPTEFAEDHYDDNSFGGHGYFGSHCDLKTWEVDFTSCREEDEFLSTNNVIEEVFGKGYCEN